MLCFFSLATDASLRFNHIYPKWTFLILVPLLFFYVYAIYQKEKGIGSWTRNILILLRVGVIFSLFFLIFEPVLETTESRINKSVVLLLVDDSLSMTLKDPYAAGDETLRDKLTSYFQLSPEELAETSRVDLVNRFLTREQEWFKQLDERCELKIFRFSESVYPDVPLGKMTAEGKKTALGDAMIQSLKNFRGKYVASMILVTDGVSNSGEQLPEDAMKLLKERSVPLYIIGVGDPEEQKDLWIETVNASKVLYEREVFNADVTINHHGFEGRRVKVYLKQQEAVLQSKELTLGPSHKPQVIQLSEEFKKEDVYNLTFEVEKQQEERIVVNNRYSHRLKILNKKIKVLYLEGYPRWEYRYLKNALIRDKMMEVYCFLYSANKNFPQEVSKGIKTGLKEFPKEEELATFDVVLLGDVGLLKEELTVEQQKNLANFVENLGGGLAFLSGPRSNPKTYHYSPLAKLLPVVIGSKMESSKNIIKKKFRPKMTPQGLIHPILRLKPDLELNRKLLEQELPEFYWYYKCDRSKPGAIELLVHPSEEDSTDLKRPLPLLVTQVYGTGNTLYVGLDEFWRWRYIIGDKYFYNFWVQAIRYLSKGRLQGENKRYSLEIDQIQYHVGDQVKITMRVLDVKFKPSDAKVQEVYVDREVEENGNLSGKSTKIELKPDKNRPGYFVGSYLIPQEGTYKIWAVTGASTEKENEISQRFHATFPIIEFEQAQMAEKRLRELGEFFFPYEVEEMSKKVKAPTTKFHINTISEELWDKWYNLIIFTILISIEWILRKINKLL